MNKIFKKRLSQFVILIHLLVFGTFTTHQALAGCGSFTAYAGSVCGAFCGAMSVMSWLHGSSLCPIVTFGMGGGIGACAAGVGCCVMCAECRRESAAAAEANARAEVSQVSDVAVPLQIELQPVVQAQGSENQENSNLPHAVQAPGGPRVSIRGLYDQAPVANSNH